MGGWEATGELEPTAQRQLGNAMTVTHTENDAQEWCDAKHMEAHEEYDMMHYDASEVMMHYDASEVRRTSCGRHRRHSRSDESAKNKAYRSNGPAPTSHTLPHN